MYFKKKSEIVVVIVLTLIVLGSFFLLLKSGNLNGLTGAGVIRIQTAVSACGTLSTTGDTYDLTQDITKTGDGACIIIGADSITLNCAGYKISYAGGAANSGIGIDNSAGYNGTTIQNCRVEGGVGKGPAIFFHNTYRGTIYNNTIKTSTAGDAGIDVGAAGIIISSSDNNSISKNNITVTAVGSYAIVLNGTSTGNSIINLNASTAGFSILNNKSSLGSNNTISYDNEFGQINVTSTNLTIPTSLAIDLNVFLKNNLTGLLGDPNVKQFNTSAKIKFKGLSYSSTPQLHKDGIRCDGTNNCNVSYNSATGVLSANISSFSNYTTLEGTAPTVSNLYPVNSSNYSNQEDIRFNVSVIDGTAVSTVLFMFNSNTTKFNRSAQNVSGIWNVTINMSTLEEKIHDVFVFANDTYNNVNQAQKTVIAVDRTVPTVSLYNSSFSIVAVPFSVMFNFTDNVFSYASCSLYVDGVSEATNATTFNGTYTRLTVTTTYGDGPHIATVNCTDGSNNKGNSTAITVTIDSTKPNVTFTGPATTSNFSTGLVDFNATIRDALSSIGHVLFQFNNGTGATDVFNRTATNYSGTWNVTLDVSTLVEGSRAIKIFANDSLGNMNGTETITITVDRTAPNVTTLLPTNSSVLVANYSGGTFALKVIATDTYTNVNKVLFQISNGTNPFNRTATLVTDGGTEWNVSSLDVSSLVEGEHTITIYANDTVNNLNNTQSMTINIDRTAPTVNLYNGSFSIVAVPFSVMFNFTDALSHAASCSLYVDSVSEATNATTFNGTYTQLTVNTAYGDGPHIVTVNCTDLLSHIGNSTAITVTIDSTKPNVTFTGPATTSNFSTGLVDFNATIRDALSSIGHVLFQFNNGTGATSVFNRTATNYSGTWNVTLDVSTLVEGSRAIKIFANDSLGNMNGTETITITVDRTAPNVTTLLPTNSSVLVANYSSGIIALKAIAKDTYTNVNKVLFQISNGTNPFNRTATLITDGGTEWNVSSLDVSVLGEGAHTITIYANDTLNNMNSTTTMSINIDRTAPNFTNAREGSADFYQNSYATFNITINDTRGVDQYIFSILNNAVGAWANETPVKVWEITSGKNHSFNISLSRQLYRNQGERVCWYFWANDTLGNGGNSSVRCVSIQAPGTTGGGTSGGDTTAAAAATTAAATTTTAAAATTETAAAVTGEAATATAAQTAVAISAGTVGFTVGEATTAAPAAAAVTAGPSAAAATAAVGGVAAGGIAAVVTSALEISNKGDKIIALAIELKKADITPLANKAEIEKVVGEQLLAEAQKEGKILSEEEKQKLIAEKAKAIELIEVGNVLSAFKAKTFSVLPYIPAALSKIALGAPVSPFKPTGEHISARLLEDVLVNADELKEIKINPGETFVGEIKIKKGLLSDSKAVDVVFKTQEQDVYKKEMEVGEPTLGTAIDTDVENKKMDIYMLVPPEDKGIYTLQLEVNKKENVQATKTFPSLVNFIFTNLNIFPKTVYTELFGPYQVNEQGALIAMQMEYDLQGEHEVIGKVFKQEQLVAENYFDVDFG